MDRSRIEFLRRGTIVKMRMLDDALAHLEAQIESAKIRIANLDPVHRAQALRVVIEAAVRPHQIVEHVLAGVAERRMPEVVRERDRFGEFLVEAERARGAGDLRGLQRVREPRAVVVALVIDENLGLVFEAAKRGGMNYAIAIALKRGAHRMIGLGFGARGCPSTASHTEPRLRASISSSSILRRNIGQAQRKFEAPIRRDVSMKRAGYAASPDGIGFQNRNSVNNAAASLERGSSTMDGASDRTMAAKTMIAKTPIAILSFNRPDYLDQTLRSLAAQSEVSLVGREIHLFQDGMFNKFSGQTYASEKSVLGNIALFNALFPSGHVHTQEVNLGIALHFDFIERYLFESRGFEAAIFLEDDMVLSPLDLTVIDKMISVAMTDESIGCVAAYGDRRASLTEQRARLSGIVTMAHRWAFALTKRQWLRQKPFMEGYLSVVAETDYAMRDHDRIIDWFISTGYLPTVTSQDGAKRSRDVSVGGVKVYDLLLLWKVHRNEACIPMRSCTSRWDFQTLSYVPSTPRSLRVAQSC